MVIIIRVLNPYPPPLEVITHYQDPGTRYSDWHRGHFGFSNLNMFYKFNHVLNRRHDLLG